MVDGRKYFSTDNWQTIWQEMPNGSPRKITDKQEADTIRFLVVYQG